MHKLTHTYYGAMAIVMVGLLVNWAGLTSPGMWWTDESRHAMHGVFFIDFMRDLPLSDPYGYVQRYFAQYPALAFNWYLPFFPALTGAFMAVFGVSEVTAHMAITVVWLLGVISWYAWMTPRYGVLAAVLSALLLLCMPVVVLWGRSVMLEAPAVAACMAGVYFFQRYLDRPAHTSAILAGAMVSFALLIKQTSLFILPVLFVYALSHGTWRRALLRWEVAWVVGAVALSLAIVVSHALLFGPRVAQAALSGATFAGSGSAELWTIERWVLYTNSLYTGAGAWITALAVIGIAMALRRGERYTILPIAWLAFSYAWCTYLTGVPGNSERYAFYAMPATAFFATYGVFHFANQPLWRGLWIGILTFGLASNLYRAIEIDHPYVAGHNLVAEHVYNLPNSGTILYAGKHDGNFVFHLRRLDRERSRIVLRGDKTLVEMSVSKYFGMKSRVQSPADIHNILNDHAVRWVVVESRDLVGLKEFVWLHDILKDPRYHLVARLPIESNVPEFQGLDILIYENRDLKLPADRRVRIGYPYLGREYEYVFSEHQGR